MVATSSNRVECLIIDLFGVIVAFDDGLVYDRIARRCPQPQIAAEEMFDLVSKPDLIRGLTSLQQLHARLVEDLRLSAPYEEFQAMWLTSYSEPMPGMRDLLHQLTAQCRLVLLSNVDLYYWSTVEDCIPELHGFHAKVLSFQQGVAKPDPQAFERAVAASGVAVDRCYFVDDKSENIEAAATIGLASHLFRNCRTLKVALRQAGLRIDN